MTSARRAFALSNRVRRSASGLIRQSWRSLPVRPNQVLYESFYGKGVICHPEAIFRCALSDPELGQLVHVWVLDAAAWESRLASDLDHDDRVQFVRYGSQSYYRALATSGFLVNNSTFSASFVKRARQTYLNTWHGTPLKTMGYDMPGGVAQSYNVLRNFVSADFLLSESRFMTERMYRGAYKLDPVFAGQVIEAGSPRSDWQFRKPSELRDVCKRGGLDLPANSPVVLYAPTWRGSSYQEASLGVATVLSATVAIAEAASDAGATVLLRPHQRVADEIGGLDLQGVQVVPQEVPVNALLGLTSVLVSDYSSISFDFVATGRPQVHYVPDLESYGAARGWYLEPGDWPGEIAIDPVALRTSVESALAAGDTHEPRSTRCGDHALNSFVLADGAASQRVVDAVFKARPNDYSLSLKSDKKPRVLLYPGALTSNGITTSFFGLVNQLANTPLDLSVISDGDVDQPTSGTERIPLTVRQFARVGPRSGTVVDKWTRRLWLRTAGGAEPLLRSRLRRNFGLEWKRNLGDACFDIVVDFSGYSGEWAHLLLSGDANKTFVWLHNDMLAESEKVVEGRTPHKNSLGSLFRLYNRFDMLVSVSPSLCELNRGNLSDFAKSDKFTWAPNILDVPRIDAQLVNDPGPDEADQLMRLGRVIVRGKTFVFVGRLSPEKNPARLIRAFSIVNSVEPMARLVVVGDGPLFDEVTQMVVDEGLEDSVYLAGHMRNPFRVMAECDCFVISSDHEGQPMVILEAMYLGLPVISTRFYSAADVVRPPGGLLVDRNSEALAAGMLAFIAGGLEAQRLDAQGYNDGAAGRFLEVIGVSGSFV